MEKVTWTFYYLFGCWTGTLDVCLICLVFLVYFAFFLFLSLFLRLRSTPLTTLHPPPQPHSSLLISPGRISHLISLLPHSSFLCPHSTLVLSLSRICHLSSSTSLHIFALQHPSLIPHLPHLPHIHTLTLTGLSHSPILPSRYPCNLQS